MNLEQKFLAAIRQNQLVKAGDHVLVAVSGGPDSTALLTLFTALRDILGIRLSVAHVNHALRKSADQDQYFVQSLCQQLHIPFYYKKIPVKTSPQKSSLEEVAREGRIAYFQTLTNQIKFDTVALGHTQDDLAETVLMRILRGSGLSGLRSMLPKRSWEKIIFIRPLLKITKKEILSFLKTNKICYRIDPTNRSREFLRNELRWEVLPSLEKKFPAIKTSLARLAETSALDYDFIESAAQTAFQQIVKKKTAREITLDIRRLRVLHPSMRSMVLRIALSQQRGDLRQLTQDHLERIESLLFHFPPGAQIPLPGKTLVAKTAQLLILR